MKATDYELIEQYFNHELSEKEAAEVLKKCTNDKLFSAAFERQKLLLEVVDEQHETKLKELLKAKEAEIIANNSIDNSNKKTQPIIRKLNYKKWFSIAASILVLVVAAYFLMNNFGTEKPTNTELFAQNFEPYRNFLIPVERGDLSEADLEKAFQNYENENYAAAIIGFEESLKDSISADVLFYKAVSELAEAETENAILSFEQSLNLNTQFEAEANWYLILANLKLGNMEVIKRQSEQFLEDFPTSVYTKKIRELK